MVRKLIAMAIAIACKLAFAANPGTGRRLFSARVADRETGDDVEAFRPRALKSKGGSKSSKSKSKKYKYKYKYKYKSSVHVSGNRNYDDDSFYCYNGGNEECPEKLSTSTLVGKGICLNSTEIGARGSDDKAACSEKCVLADNCNYYYAEYSVTTKQNVCALFANCAKRSTESSGQTYQQDHSLASISFSDSSYSYTKCSGTEQCFTLTEKSLTSGCVTERRGCKQDLSDYYISLSCGSSAVKNGNQVDINCCSSTYCNPGNIAHKLSWAVAFVAMMLLSVLV